MKSGIPYRGRIIRKKSNGKWEICIDESTSNCHGNFDNEDAAKRQVDDDLDHYPGSGMEI
jgi:hypothetical protein